MNRLEMLRHLDSETEWDIVIIGGGATGLGSAVDAASRGYKTLLVEQFDFAKGTSSRATKLVHGGVRYLAQGNIKLVMEALRERGYLLKNAPHVTKILPFVVPVYKWIDKFYYGMGLKIYDRMSGKLSLGKTRLLNKKETLQYLPELNEKKLKGGILYADGQFDDARLAIDLAITANKNGATLLNYCEANSFIKTKNKISAVVVTDTINNKEFILKTKSVINATGVFSDEIMEMDDSENDELIELSQGIHLVVDKKYFPSETGMMVPKTDDGRVLFAVPWHDKVILGTTDTPVDFIDVEPQPMEEEIEFVLHHANKYFKQNISRNDVSSMFAGLRPLVKKKGAKSTALLNRDHTIIVSTSNLVTVTGGKWTTYRKMAQDAVDNAAFVAKLSKEKCVTKDLPIHQSLVETENFLNEKFHCDENDIKYFVENEMAMTVEDVLARRTRLLFLDVKEAVSLAPFVAKTMAALMNKNDAWIKDQIEDFTEIAKQYCLT
jgi:glycerol-3-phosphate dehydrogenase